MYAAAECRRDKTEKQTKNHRPIRTRTTTIRRRRRRPPPIRPRGQNTIVGGDPSPPSDYRRRYHSSETVRKLRRT